MPWICLRCFASKIFAGIDDRLLRDSQSGRPRVVIDLPKRIRLTRAGVRSKPNPSRIRVGFAGS